MEDRPICPKCGSHRVVSKFPQWRCRDCGAAWLKGGGELIQQSEPLKEIEHKPFEIETIDADKTLVALFDAHLDPQAQNHISFEIAMRFTLDTKPNIILLGGDWMEMGSLSAWDRRRRYLMEGRRYDLEIAQGQKQLIRLRKVCPEARIIFFEGNHEYRLPRYLEEHSEMVGKLNIRADLGLNDMGIEWVPFNQVIKIGKLNFLHGLFYNIYFARSTLQSIGESCLFGHSHKSQTYVQRLHNDKTPNIAQGVGCLCTIDPQWKRGMPTNFVNSFAIVEFRDKGFFNTHEIFVINGAMSYGGHTWKAT